MKKNKGLIEKLFTPFKFIAGAKALYAGFAIMLLLSVLGYLSNTHFDGVLDIHYGCPTTSNAYLDHFLYQIVVWISLTVVFYITGRIVTKSSVRLIDVAGTMALSQAPLIFPALLGFVPSFHVCFGNLDTIDVAEVMAILKDHIVMLTVAGLVLTVFVIWSVILKYNAYAVSANVKGVKGGVSFAVALIISEILSKIFFYILL